MTRPASRVASLPDNRLSSPIDALLDRGKTDAASSGWGDWQPVLDDWRRSREADALVRAIDARVAEGATVYPGDVFRALALTSLADTRVVILGQDPYHGPGQADGLAFSVPAGVPPPPSLRNLLAEQARDLQRPTRRDGHLAAWARGGVLLLNTSLTVEDGEPGSHSRLGWWALTDRIVEALAADRRPKVFLLWGSHAQARAPIVEAAGAGHVVLKANHPSPLAARRLPVPFMGCAHFSKALDALRLAGVEWSWPD